MSTYKLILNWTLKNMFPISYIHFINGRKIKLNRKLSKNFETIDLAQIYCLFTVLQLLYFDYDASTITFYIHLKNMIFCRLFSL